ncbi:MAG: hypothetical protein MJ178_00090 [Treponemataceae bacterium]|nr:hypothetical protein [Treponemataceae bacterium]
MIEIREVHNRKEIKQFIEFPCKLYKGNKCFVPPLYGDELSMFRKDYVYNDMCEHVFFNAYDNGKMVGRIQGILQRTSNELRNEKRIRFTRFDAINSQEVADALFDAVENWGRSKGMTHICGPLGYSDMEREGLLIEGFDQVATFEEQYNADYYQKLIEHRGYQKEVDWTEGKLTPSADSSHMEDMAGKIMNRYHLRMGPAKNTNDFLKRYADKFFEMYDKTYGVLYQTVPFTEGMKKVMIANFRLIIKLQYVGVILDESDDIVGIGLCFPSLAGPLAGTNGKLTPWRLIKLLWAINHPKVLDLAIIGVDPVKVNQGISIILLSEFNKMMKENNIQWAETNLMLESNYFIQNAWKRFNQVPHKRRRSYLKEL